MSAQVLSSRSTRRIARATGLEIARAWGHGGYVMNFVTVDHEHGWWNKKTGEWGLDDKTSVVHYTSCAWLFPPKKAGDTLET
jgi:hypothetical protein